ncbi:MAG: hypothetical protein ABL931_18795 [Usitatibacteraceae bacterium]
MPRAKYYINVERPTFKSVLADKHLKASLTCLRLVQFYTAIGDNVSAYRWRVVMLEKRRDAERADRNRIRNQQRAFR